MTPLLVAPAQAGAQSEATLQLKFSHPENIQTNDLLDFQDLKTDRQATLHFALDTRLRGCDSCFFTKISAYVFKGQPNPSLLHPSRHARVRHYDRND